jgi:integrase
VSKLSLTAQTIKGLKPPASGRVEYFDADTKGLCLRISHEGLRTWTLFYRTGAIQKRLTLGRYPAVSLADARDLARGAQLAVAKGGDPSADKKAARSVTTFADLANVYLTQYAKRTKRTWKDDERTINAELLPRWKSRPAAAVTRKDVREALNAMVERGAPIMANRVRALVSKMYNWAIQNDIVDANPVVGVAKPGREQSRERVLTEDEIRRFWEACDTQNPRIAAWCRLRLTTAQRGGELLKMRWQDLEGPWWTIPGEFVKNGQGHRAYLNETSRAALGTVPKTEDSEWVFPGAFMGDVPHVSRRIAKEGRAGIPDFRGHDLRRTAASYMTSAGVPRLVVKRILNHSEKDDITGVYDRYSYDREKKKALDQWERRLQAILTKQTAPKKVVRFGR